MLGGIHYTDYTDYTPTSADTAVTWDRGTVAPDNTSTADWYEIGCVDDGWSVTVWLDPEVAKQPNYAELILYKEHKQNALPDLVICGALPKFSLWIRGPPDIPSAGRRFLTTLGDRYGCKKRRYEYINQTRYRNTG